MWEIGSREEFDGKCRGFGTLSLFTRNLASNIRGIALNYKGLHTSFISFSSHIFLKNIYFTVCTDQFN